MMAACSALQCEGGSQMAIVIKTLSEQIYDYVFREIRIGHLKYGDKIDENELIERLGISRTPIREPFPVRGFMSAISVTRRWTMPSM